MNMKFVRTWAMLALVMVIGLSVTGGTIAWFTDSVESTGNVIQAGNLKIDLELKGEKGWTSLKDNADTPVFNYTLWEPGYTEMKTLKISNEGNLALKYELRVNPLTGEVKGPNGESLADVIDVYMAFGEHDSTNTKREDLSDTSVWWKCGTLSSMIAAEEGFTQGALLPASTNASENVLIQQGLARGEIVTTLALKMQEDAGNEYQGLTLGDASFTLNATQYTYEEDAFDEKYDAGATYAPTTPSDKPVADVNKLAETDPAYPTEIDYSYSPVTDENAKPQTLDVAYRFTAPETEKEALEGKYGHWHADFVVYADKNVPAKSIALAGQYDVWPWLGFANPDEIAAGTKIRLLYDAAGITVPYSDVCAFKDFYCGATAINEEALAGTTLTVELRLYEVTDKAESENNSWNEETGEYITVGTFTHKF